MTQSPASRRNGEPLVRVDEVEPSPAAVDELKGDGVVVHHVGHRPAIRDTDVRGDHRSAEAPRNQVPVLHAGAADDPRLPLAHPPHDQFMAGRRPYELRFPRTYLDTGAIGSLDLGLARGERLRTIAEQADGAGRVVRAAVQPDAQSVAGHHRHRRIVGGKDRLETETQCPAVERQVRVQVAARQPHFGLCRAACGHVIFTHVATLSCNAIAPAMRLHSCIRRGRRTACILLSPASSTRGPGWTVVFPAGSERWKRRCTKFRMRSSQGRESVKHWG